MEKKKTSSAREIVDRVKAKRKKSGAKLDRGVDKLLESYSGDVKKDNRRTQGEKQEAVEGNAGVEYIKKALSR